jgi:hypothetical protein
MTMHAPQAEQPEPGRRRWAVLTVVSAAQFLIVLGLWVVNVALPALQPPARSPATIGGEGARQGEPRWTAGKEGPRVTECASRPNGCPPGVWRRERHWV